MLQQLTDQHLRVVHHFVKGLTDQGIALEMGLADSTIRNYIATIQKRLAVSSRQELMKCILDNWKQIHDQEIVNEIIENEYPKEVEGIISFNMVGPALFWLKNQISAFNPDTICAINRGGLILGAMLGKLLDLDSKNVRRIFIENERSKGMQLNSIVRFDEIITSERLLLVDDAYYTRQNVPTALKALRELDTLRTCSIKSAVFLFQMNRPFRSSEIDYYPFFTRNTTTRLPWNSDSSI
ncbi:LuxR C-terminal-related transcriptional regulator [Chloroflexota bacterium]